jgi:tetratricopeptide (TPR) repeat protein
MNVRPLLLALTGIFAAAGAALAHDHPQTTCGPDTTEAGCVKSHKPTPPKQITREELIDRIREQSDEATGKHPDYAKVIQTTTRLMIDNLKNGKDKMYDADQAGASGPLFDVQIQQQVAEWKLNERRSRLKPSEYADQLKGIKKRASEDMERIPSGVIMDVFHPNFDRSWQEFQSRLGDVNAPASGLPPRSHIGDMLNADPKNAANWALSGAEKLQNGDVAGGLGALNQAIALGGTADAFGLRGGVRLDNKDYEGAYADALAALKLSPGDQALMGLLKSAEGRLSPERAAAIAAGTGSSGGVPGGAGGGSERPSSGAGFAAGGFGSSAGLAVADMTAASVIASSQKLEEARRALAMGDVSTALALAQRAIELNPGNAAAHSFLSKFYARKGDYPSAIAAASAGLVLAPRDGVLLNDKAFAQNRAKQYRDALESSNFALEADSRNPYGYANRAYAYGGLGDRESMLSDINQAAAMDPRFQTAAADAAALQLPSAEDILFMFPGENPADPAVAAAARPRSLGLLLGAVVIGGLLLALGLLSTILAPLKESVVSAFTRATRRGPSLHELEVPDGHNTEDRT